MLFKFLKYIQPTSYFNLVRKDNTTVFPNPDFLPKEVRSQLIVDNTFKSNVSTAYDLAWQATQLGYIGSTETISFNKIVPIEDEYRFICKYYNRFWSVYILLLRILSFHNPFKEFSGWYKSLVNRRSTYLNSPIKHNNWLAFKSELIVKNPKISVIIPTLNRYEYLKDVLLDLEHQNYVNFDVIIVDQSEPYDKDFYTSFNLDIKLIRQEEKALWKARNTAVKISDADYLLLFDDDSRIEKDWITNHLKCLDFFKASISSGVSISVIGDKVPQNYSFFRVSDQIDTGNVLIKRDVFQTIGLFDRQFEKQRMGDGEYGLRAYLEGFLNVSNPYAKRLHLKVGTGGLRQMGSWDGFRPKKFFDPRPVPSVLYLFRKYFGSKLTILAILKTVPPSIIPYRFKANKILMLFGFMFSLVFLPIIFFQVCKSWCLATNKINEGALIEKI
jgi:glycosyltransferase involved in cell wall biosynthesis